MSIGVLIAPDRNSPNVIDDAGCRCKPPWMI
jgi:hypothetical protein